MCASVFYDQIRLVFIALQPKGWMLQLRNTRDMTKLIRSTKISRVSWLLLQILAFLILSTLAAMGCLNVVITSAIGTACDANDDSADFEDDCRNYFDTEDWPEEDVSDFSKERKKERKKQTNKQRARLLILFMCYRVFFRHVVWPASINCIFEKKKTGKLITMAGYYFFSCK